MVIPLLERAGLAGRYERSNLKNALGRVSRPGDVSLALETDLSAPDSLRLLEWLDDSRVRLCYDFGNAHAFGHDPTLELPELIGFIDEIHVKDRSVVQSHDLGQGTTPVLEGVRLALELGYNGAFILETPAEPDWAICARRNLNYLLQILAEAAA